MKALIKLYQEKAARDAKQWQDIFDADRARMIAALRQVMREEVANLRR